MTTRAESTPQHTPTPEYWLDDDHCLAHGGSDRYRTVAQFLTATPEEEAEIVRAVNSHAALVEALERVLEWADPCALPQCDRNERDVEFARAAVAAAKGMK